MAMTLRLTEDDAAALREAAAKEGRSMQEVAITAVREYLAKRDEFRGAQVERFLHEDAELLDLLSR
jgi:predicted transcriptional regulator